MDLLPGAQGEEVFEQKERHQISIESIACFEIADFKSVFEPAQPLVRTSMGKGVRDHMPLGFPLDPVTNRAGGVQPFLLASN